MEKAYNKHKNFSLLKSEEKDNMVLFGLILKFRKYFL